MSWPSVRAALAGLTALLAAGAPPHAPLDAPLTVATYNIRHGRGMDGRVDLERTAAAVAALGADVVALQEVDRVVERSGGVDQARELGERLGMHHAFGAFFPYQGGEYGMAILSRLPVVRAEALRLPEGNEPRVALLAEIEVASGRRILAVNVHFDWVEDDTFRRAQVAALAAVLDTVRLPTVLLGDFNDVPGSRTLEAWRGAFDVAAKPPEHRFTFPSADPRKEIDHVLVGPRGAWGEATARAVVDPVTSDHRAVVAVLTLRAATGPDRPRHGPDGRPGSPGNGSSGTDAGAQHD